MYIHSCTLSDKRKIPILFGRASDLPVLVPFLYVTLKRQYKAFNTVRNDLVAIKAFYEFHAIHDRNLDESIIAGQFILILRSIEQFVAWISVAKLAANVIGRIGHQETNSASGIAPITRDAYLRSLKLFLTWCAQRYASEITSHDGIRQSFNDLSTTIAMRFDGFLLAPSARQLQYRSLSDVEIECLRSVCHPKSLSNPFRVQNRRRNWLMLEVLIETGIRLGELLLLTTIDVAMGHERCYLTVMNHGDAGDDTRSTPPSIKTKHSERTISISKDLFNALQLYIQNGRRPHRNGQPMKLAHRYLWVSERGLPLAANSASSIVERLVKTTRKTQPSLLKTATPHSFRYTFAERFLSYLVDVKCVDMERAKDELRTICGWSESSDMPQYYARRHIHNMANQHNAERIAAAWNRLKMYPSLET